VNLTKMKSQKGLSLIDVLVGVSLILIVFLGVFGAFRLGFKAIYQAQNKIAAGAIANQRIEMARNSNYESVGTIGATLPYAEGSFESQESITQNGIDYLVETQVKYVIDDADGIADPQDTCPNDYKRINIGVSWPGIFGSEIFLSTDIMPNNLVEECVQSGGVLSVLVFDAFGEMVSSPLIEVFSTETSQLIDYATPTLGQHYFPLPAETYEVRISKTGYSSEETYGIDEVAIPEKPNPIVLEGGLIEMSFSIDELSSFSVQTLTPVGQEFVLLGNVVFELQGEKLIGLDENEDPIYKYSETLTTNLEGGLTISNLEWDSYAFSVDPDTDLDLIDIDPLPQPISLLPNSSQQVSLYLDSENSLVVYVKNTQTSEPIPFAEVRLSGSQYDETFYTDENGQTYFVPLKSGNHNLEISASGYSPYSGSVVIAGDVLENIFLQQVE